MQKGSLVGYAHFSWNGCDLPKGFPIFVTTKEIDFVELLQFSKINTQDYYDYLNLGFRITAAAGSDIPWGSTLGEVRTFVYTGKYFSADLWFNGLKKGNSFVSNGPALFFSANEKLPGSEIIIKDSTIINLKVKAFSNIKIGELKRVALYNNDGLIFEKNNPQHIDSIEISENISITKSQWITAIAECENGAVAHATPIYFIVNGFPSLSKEKAPSIIQNILLSIKNTEAELKSNGKLNNDIFMRMEKARNFYNSILENIQK